MKHTLTLIAFLFALPLAFGQDFGSQQVITLSADGATCVYATDLDGDGDADVLSASRYDDKIAWYENLGGGSFGSQQVITLSANGAFSVYATDLDGDGDVDVLSASIWDDKIAWYENLMFTDCNGNGIHDGTDIADGTSQDDNGNGVPDECECLSREYCPSAGNSTGVGSLISFSGSQDIPTNTFTLLAAECPPGEMGLFFYGPSEVNVPFFNGFRCVGGPFFRIYPPNQIAGNGQASHHVDFNTPPMNSGAGAITPGSTWYFQFWFRDPAAGASGVNLSDGLESTFCP